MDKFIEIKPIPKNKKFKYRILKYDKYQDKSNPDDIIQIHKKFKNNAFFKDSYCTHLMLILLMDATPYDIEYPAKNFIIELKRGEGIKDQVELQKETGIAYNTVAKKLKMLQGISKDVIKIDDNDISYINTNTPNTNILIKNKIRDVEDCLRAIKPTTHRETISYFCGKHFGKTGTKYHVQGAKDGMLVKKLLQTYSLNEIRKMIDTFFDIKSDFIENKAGYTIGVFYKTMGTTIVQMKKTSGKSKYAGLSEV